MSKKYNCPDCNRTDSCEGCYRVTTLPVNLHHSEQSIFQNDPCENCNNNPKNGGTGVCFCILGSMQTWYE